MPIPSAPPPTLVTLAAAVTAAGMLSAAAHVRRRLTAAGSLKMAAASGYVLLALAGGATTTPYGRLLLLGLGLCWLGDLLLIPEGKGPAFLGGLASFLLGHVAYASAFWVSGASVTWTAGAAVPAAAVGGAVLRWLWAAHLARSMRGPVVAYVAAITAMVALAWGCAGAGAPWTVPAGAVAFMASDVFVARERFVTPGRWNTLAGRPLYFLGQALLALSV